MGKSRKEVAWQKPVKKLMGSSHTPSHGLQPLKPVITHVLKGSISQAA